MHKPCCVCHFYNIFGDNDIAEWISCSCGTSILHATCKSAITKEFVFSCCGMVEAPFGPSQEIPETGVQTVSIDPAFQNYAKNFKLGFKSIIKKASNSIPCILQWDTRTLGSFFQSLGCEEAAKQILLHEMSGEQFLLLTKDEMYKNFKFSKRMAGKVYKHQKLLQWKVQNLPM